ncbi:secretin N-terminal domain-containing protein [Thioalkalivibrio sp. ALJ1]|uniref:secretin N-terminal domain-containing protein n=1 Tax=Thioalkalivibrio sp. ALJ1 TaxID=1158144 RepID=UPI0005705E96|nr:secretin N-terminal domain-containing protein [Thioalkalivibrio sp. ALJ1]
MKPSKSAASTSERRRLLRTIGGLACGLLLPAGATSARDAHDEVAVLPLNNRPAREVLSELQGLFGEAATLRADGFRLLVRADARTLQQIREVVAELDQPARELTLYVRRAADAPGSQRGAGIDFETGPDGTRGRGTVTRRTTNRRDDRTQQVRLREGTEATILVGETEAQGLRVFVGPAGFGTEPIFRDTARGFRVRPQVQPDGRIRVAIEHLHEQPAGAYRGHIHRETVTTALTLEPDQWHDLAGSAQTTTHDERGLASRRSTRDRDAMTLQIRVDALD